jgi:hypothetical protein
VTEVLRGYAKRKDGTLVVVGTVPVPQSKDEPSPRERQEKRHLAKKRATIFRKEIAR